MNMADEKKMKENTNNKEEKSKSTTSFKNDEKETAVCFSTYSSDESPKQNESRRSSMDSPHNSFWKESYWSIVASTSFLLTGLVRAYTSPALFSIKSEVYGYEHIFNDTSITNGSAASTSILISYATSTKNDLISWIASMPPLASFIGTVLSGPCLDQLGRRQTIFILSIIATVGWILVGKATSISFLLLGRALTGFSCGLATAAAPLYISEVCQSQHHSRRSSSSSQKQETENKGCERKRGRQWLGLVPGILLATGILLGFILAHQFQHWQKLALIISVFPFLLSIFSWTIPESPVWIEGKSKNNETTFDLEMDEIAPAALPTSSLPPLNNQQKKGNLSLSESTGLIPKRSNNSFFRVLLLISAYQIFQQFSGGNVLIYYLSEILTKNSNLSSLSSMTSAVTPEPDIVHQASLIIGLVQFIGFLLALPLIDNKRVGQRNLLIISAALMSLAHLVLGFHFQHQINHPIPSNLANHNDEPNNTSWTFAMLIRVCSLSVLFCCYSIGMGPIPFLFIQIYSNIAVNDEEKVKSIGESGKMTSVDNNVNKNNNKAMSYLSSAASLVNHLALFTVVKMFPYLFNMEYYGPSFTFWIFAGVCWVAAIFTFYFIPAAHSSSSEHSEAK